MSDHRWLVLNLEAPLLAFGGVRIDHIGVTRDFPSLSMMTGLLANALGYVRTEWEKHQNLQDQLVFAARWDRHNPSGLLTDTQNAKLEREAEGWTTWGEPEGRGGGVNTYKAPHRRLRDYHMDAHVKVVLRLKEEAMGLDLDKLASRLNSPVRPLFIGRKPCLPSGPLLPPDPFVVAPTAYAALQRVPGEDRLRALWPLEEGPSKGDSVDRILDLPDIRNWRTGLHGGVRKIVEGKVRPERQVA